MRDLLGGFWTVDIQDRVLVMRRTSLRSTDMQAFLASFDGVYESLSPRSPGETGLLIDLRASVGRNDPQFERQLVERRRELFRRFLRSCVLVKSAIGRLQVQRHVDEDGFGGSVKVFAEESRAIAWLRQAL